ncbi:AlpA family phage regulatory protein [Vibrio parahaemolyticus]|nr:AlpA family phage regulatory protein [Vibrio parahaemolyticus]
MVIREKGLFPRRIRLGNRSVAWRLSEVLEWIETREGVQ